MIKDFYEKESRGTYFSPAAGYGEVGRASLGFNLAYLFAERKSHDFKAGLELKQN